MTQTRSLQGAARSESAADIDAAAQAWAARSDRGPLSPQDEVALREWLEADPRRAGAYARALAADVYLSRAAALGAGFDPRKLSTRPAMGRRRVITAGGGLLAASLVASAGLGLSSWRSRIVTPKGDVRRVSLPEGSAVTLNTATAVRPDLGDQLRRVDLIRGEALFDVAKDHRRPFIVFAGGVRVRAVGTSFSVRVREDREVEVQVREGVVEVWRRSDTSPVRLTAGGVALAPRQGPISHDHRPIESVERAMAWREGRIDLAGMSLAEAAAEFRRYSDRAIVTDDETVARMTVAGVYSISDPEGFARAAALSLGLEAVVTPSEIELRRSELS